jgi:hypothetical protein
MSRPREENTGVPCPCCGRAALVIQRGCLHTRFVCPGCSTPFGLEQLARLLDDARFASLAELVGDRLADRV